MGSYGRRIDDHPWCVACQFDLYGLPEAREACPECGAKIKAEGAVRVGQRRRRPRLLATGAIMTLLCGTPVAMTAIVDIDWYRHMPPSLLRREMQNGPPAVRIRAFEEMTRRISAGQVSDKHVADWLVWSTVAYRDYPVEFSTQGWPVIDPNQDGALYRDLILSCLTHLIARTNDGWLDYANIEPCIAVLLEVQGDSEIVWISEMGEMLELAHRQDWLTPTQWERYRRQMIQPYLRVRQRVGVGDPIPFVYGARWRRARVGGFSWHDALNAIRIGDTEVTDIGRWEDEMKFASRGHASPLPSFVTQDHLGIETLKPGPTTLSIELEVIEHSLPGDPNTNETRRFTLSRDFRVVPREDAKIRVHHHELENERRLLHLTSSLTDLISYGVAFHTVQVRLGGAYRPDFDLAYDAHILVEDQAPSYLGTMTYSSEGLSGGRFHVDAPSPRPKPYRIILKPSIEAAKRSIDIYEIWGEEITIEGTYIPHVPFPGSSK